MMNSAGDKIELATLNFVRQMASGGMKNENIVADDIDTNVASVAIIQDIHEKIYPSTQLMKPYQLKKMQDIFAPYTKGSRLLHGRAQFVRTEALKYPYVLKYDTTLDGFHVINVNWKKLSKLAIKFGKNTIGTIEDCGVI